MTNQERIEAYFDNQLSADEQQELFQHMESDASLKSEFEFQQEIVDAIKAYRKQELINRLDNVRVASGAQSALLKTIGLVSIAVVLSGVAYWIYSPNTESDQKITKKPQIEEKVIEENPVELEQIEIPEQDENKMVVETPTPSPQQTTEATQNPKTIVAENETKKSTIPQVLVPEMTEPGKENTIDLEENLEAPEAMSSEAISIKSSTDVTIKLNKKYPFHYQIKDGDLVLYGNFGDSTFEVIELKTTNGINSYLFYKENFYELKDNSSEIQPLVTLENNRVIDALKKRQ